MSEKEALWLGTTVLLRQSSSQCVPGAPCGGLWDSGPDSWGTQENFHPGGW